MLLTIFIIKTELQIPALTFAVHFLVRTDRAPHQSPGPSQYPRSKALTNNYLNSDLVTELLCYLVDSPGMVDIVPTKGYKNPAPTDALTSLMGMTNPVGAPFLLGSEDRER